MLLKMQLYRNLVPCRLINWHRHCEGQQCLIFTFEPSKVEWADLGLVCLKKWRCE